MPKAIRSQVTCAALVLLSMVLVGWIRLLPQGLGIVDERSQARNLRSEMTYTGGDGREHVYLGDLDSYLFLRHARNYLRTGTACDAVVDGACRDTYTNAPVGARTPYARSLHVAAIVGVHELVTWFRPSYPLPSSAFLVPVIVGVLGVLPAFFIARGLAGTSAGVFAAVLTAIHPIALIRTIGSDNDVWNVVLPLYMVWAMMGALSTATSRRGAVWAGLAGVTVGLQAWAWRGWPFAYVVMTAGLVSAACAHAARYGIRRRTPRIWQAPDLRRMVVVLAVFYLVAGAAVSVIGSDEPYLAIPVQTVGALIHAIGANAPDGRGAVSDWPSTLTTVAELAPLRSSDIARAMGGTAAFLGSVVGLLLLLLPIDRWRWWHHAVLMTGVLAGGYGVVGVEPSRAALLALLSVPLAAALIVQWWPDEEPPVAHRGVVLIAIVWYLAALVTAFDGVRFLVLLAPPFGIACAVVIGRLDAWITRAIRTMPGWYRPVGAWALGGVLVLLLLHPVHWGYAAAQRYAPMMRDTWWDALTRLRDTAQPDAIVHTWWDYGHWVKYVAERRVSNDGTSLQTHVPHWLARALVAPTEAESVGVLRMLSCGSDATPLPEGARGAYGKLREGGRDPVTAYATVSDIVPLDEAAATAYLAQRGVTPAQRMDILRSTHCHPPDGYLVLSSALLTRRQTWMSLGLWDPRRDESMPNARNRSPAAEPPAVLFVSNWLPCRAARRGGDMMCDVQLTLGRRGSLLRTFTYRSAAPPDARLHIRGRGETPVSDATTEGTPAAVLVAAADRMEEVKFSSPTHPDVAVLIDVPGERILVGAPSFLPSTFVHLMYLDGRYARHYRKHDDRTGLNERVVTWKIQWEGT